MQANTFQAGTMATAIYPGAGTGNNEEMVYLGLGLASEAGEVAGKIKKLIRDGTYDPGGLAYEIGDCLWYCARLADTIGYELEDIMEINYNKLMKRKMNDTLTGSGDSR